MPPPPTIGHPPCIYFQIYYAMLPHSMRICACQIIHFARHCSYKCVREYERARWLWKNVLVDIQTYRRELWLLEVIVYLYTNKPNDEGVGLKLKLFVNSRVPERIVIAFRCIGAAKFAKIFTLCMSKGQEFNFELGHYLNYGTLDCQKLIQWVYPLFTVI